MICHVHPGTNMGTTYFGYTWWDNEADGEAMYPHKQHNPSEEEKYETALRNPEGAAARGLWSDTNFLEKTGSPEFNSKLQQSQFADFHSHGWIFRAVYKRDRQGNLLDADNKIVARRRSPEIQQSRPPRGYPPGKRNALRRLPFRAGRPRQRQALRRARPAATAGGGRSGSATAPGCRCVGTAVPSSGWAGTHLQPASRPAVWRCTPGWRRWSAISRRPTWVGAATDAERVVVAAAALRDLAQMWWTALCAPGGAGAPTTWAAFRDAITKQYQPQSPERWAMQQLHELCDGTSWRYSNLPSCSIPV